MLFTDVLNTYNVPYQTSGRYAREGWVQFHCPWCTGGLDPNKPYMGYHIAHGYVNCWRCGRHNTVDTVVKLTGEGWQRIKELLGKVDRLPTYKREHTGRLVLPPGIGPLGPAHRRYLREERGLDPDEMVRLWGLGGIGLEGGRLKWRIYVPIHYRGEVVSWTTRAIGGKVAARYISAGTNEEAVPHKTILYGEDYCRHAVVVHEGPGDVWRTGPGAVCVCGTAVSPRQIAAIARFPYRTICFDSQPEAQARARRLCNILSLLPGDTANVVLDAKDAGSATDKEIAQLRRTCLE